MNLATLNTLEPTVVVSEFLRCCGSRRWADAMAAARPFATEEDLFAAADWIWNSLAPEDWLEAFAAHPRIGGVATSKWSRAEQSGVESASSAVQDELARLNVEYEAHFGHVFLICATGRSAAEMLAELRRRLHRSPAEELRLAAAEQAKITRLRLEKLLTTPEDRA